MNLGSGIDSLRANIREDPAARGSPEDPIYQSMTPEAARLYEAGLTFRAIAERFGVDDHTVAKAVRWLRPR